MSLADDFVKQLAAVECDHTVSIPIAWMADSSDQFGHVIKGDNRPYEIRAAEAKACLEARCVFCIARAALQASPPRLCGVDMREAGKCQHSIPCHTHGIFI